MANKNIEVLLFDLGGVIVDIDFDRVFSHWIFHGNTSPVLASHQFAILQTYHQHECGEINFYEFYRNVSEQLNLNLSEQHFLEGWNKIFLGLMPGIEALLKSIPEMIPKYVFSNTNVTHEQVWREKYSGVLRHFRQIYTSVELGMRKPDHAAYREVLSRIGAKPEQVLFFDDSRENIIGAREYGIESVLVQSSDDIKKALKRYQLL